MTFREYVELDAHNWSSIKHIEESPLAYKHAKVAQREETSFFRVGRGTHCLTLEGEAKFKSEFVLKTKATGEGSRKANAAAKAHAAAAGLTVLDEEEMAAVIGASAAVRTNPWAVRLLSRGHAEKVLTWTDKETGLRCKCRADFLGRSLVDLKTALRIGRRVFTTNAVTLGYPGQFAFYEEGCAANGIEFEGDPHMIVVQSVMPHDVVIYRMTREAMEFGRRRVRRNLRILAECLDVDYWPGAGAGGPIDFELPPWAKRAESEGWSLTGDGASTYEEAQENEAKESA